MTLFCLCPSCPVELRSTCLSWVRERGHLRFFCMSLPQALPLLGDWSHGDHGTLLSLWCLPEDSLNQGCLAAVQLREVMSMPCSALPMTAAPFTPWNCTQGGGGRKLLAVSVPAAWASPRHGGRREVTVRKTLSLS